MSERKVRIAIIGAGKVSDYHHVPGIALDPRAELVAACDVDRQLAEKRRTDWKVSWVTEDPAELFASPEIDAVILATPNSTHRPLALSAAAAGKHVLCEKPLGLEAREAEEMYGAARDAGIVHMTAFTYRFAPAMRYLKHLVESGALGTPRHFRSQRFLDLPETSWGWRQYRKTAGAGDLFDMTIHRIDFAIDLLGPIRSVAGAIAQFAWRDRTEDGRPSPPSEVDDWSAILGEFRSGAVGVWEGTTLAKGYSRGGFGHEWAEVNGTEASAVYQLHVPNTILIGRSGSDLEPVEVPPDFLKSPGSPRDPAQGEPATVFRYDVVWEFVSAIVEKRPARPSFYDGLAAQLVADAVLESYAERRWIDVPFVPQ
ncbi:MAG: gfo/Idh/MocA family oxidoreductase [Acidobacteria bacterium]|nr:MAG: gfo/Idh/MocA family oxidoreductase [Acidobacteriota bacterium]